MNCPSCGAPLKLAPGNTSLRCDYCKIVVAIAADDTGVQFLDEAPELTCATCQSALWKSVLAAIELDACKKCHGLLVPMGAFEALVEKMRALHTEREIPGLVDEKELDRRVICPKCRQRMDTHFYFGGGHAVMSTCERCELHWLDGGMLMRIVRAPEANDAWECGYRSGQLTNPEAEQFPFPSQTQKQRRTEDETPGLLESFHLANQNPQGSG
jgi:LSD1 subclass zinc finger protein